MFTTDNNIKQNLKTGAIVSHGISPHKDKCRFSFYRVSPNEATRQEIIEWVNEWFDGFIPHSSSLE